MMCDPHDIGVSIGDDVTGESMPPREIPQRLTSDQASAAFYGSSFSPNIFIYDNYPGGIGLSPSLFDLEKKYSKPVWKPSKPVLVMKAAPPVSDRLGKAAKRPKR